MDEAASEQETPLRKVRKATSQTLEGVAAAVGIDVTTLSRIERGERTSPETAEKLAKYFQLVLPGGSVKPLIDELQILYPERYTQ